MLTPNKYELVLLASNADLIQHGLDDLCRGTEFKVTAKVGGPLFTRHREGDQISSDLMVVKEVLCGSDYMVDKATACEFFLVGNSKNMHRPDPHGSLYAVVPAHLVLTDKECIMIASGKSDINDVRNTVWGRAHTTRYTLVVQDTGEKFDLGGQPLLCYRHYYKEQASTSSTRFTADFALLKIDQIYASKLLNPSAHNTSDKTESSCVTGIHPQTMDKFKDMMSVHQEYHFLESNWFNVPVGKIFKPIDLSDLKEMYKREVRVTCKGFLGYLYQIFLPLPQRGRSYCHNLTFVRENKG